jgi:hypothetical protein
MKHNEGSRSRQPIFFAYRSLPSNRQRVNQEIPARTLLGALSLIADVWDRVGPSASRAALVLAVDV